MAKPFFSIIIPALNEARYLPKLLGDLTTQTYRDFEVIVVDGHSDDATVAKAKTFIPQLPKLTVVNSPRRHVCTQRNLGAKHARAEIFIFMDADNRLPSYFLQGVKYRLESEPADIFNFWLKPDKPSPSSDLIAFSINLATELQHNLKPYFMLESMIAITSPAFARIGGFDESVNYAEGVELINSANQLQLKFNTFHDPIYYFSFRRFRKFGNLTILRHTAQLGLSQLFGHEYKNINAKKLYPMIGGTLFNRPRKAKNQFLKNLSKIIEQL